MLLVPLMVLAACATGADSAEGPAPADTASEADPYLVERDDPAEPTLTTADLELLVADAIANAWNIEATPLFTAYNAVMAAADAGCPNYYEQDGNQYWYDECTAESGAEFSGYAFYYGYEGTDIDGVIYDGGALYGVGSATAADGSRLEFGGSAAGYRAYPAGIAEDAPEYYIYGAQQLQGGFSWDGADAPEWLGAEHPPDLVAQSYYVPAYDGRYVALDGSFGSDAETATVFDTFTLWSDNLITWCPNEPYGSISVRDAEGEWYDILFHGPEAYESEVDEALCDGCGDAWFHGEPLGRVCGDFSGLTDWGTTPWSD